MMKKLCALETQVMFGFYWMADDNKGGAGGVVNGQSPHVAFVPSPGLVIKTLIDILGMSMTSAHPRFCHIVITTSSDDQCNISGCNSKYGLIWPLNFKIFSKGDIPWLLATVVSTSAPDINCVWDCIKISSNCVFRRCD